MSGSGSMAKATLLAAFASSQREDAAVGFAVAALAAVGSDEVRLSPVARKELLEIYGRRLSATRPHVDGLAGADRLLDDFVASETDVLLAVTLEHDGRVTTVWLDDDGRHLVGVISGLDKRSQ